MTKIVRKSLSDSPMTAKRKRRLAKLAKRPDSAIDFCDIPELTGKFWENAVCNPFYRPVKKPVSMARPGGSNTRSNVPLSKA
jgi:hypothetical protein